MAKKAKKTARKPREKAPETEDNGQEYKVMQMEMPMYRHATSPAIKYRGAYNQVSNLSGTSECVLFGAEELPKFKAIRDSLKKEGKRCSIKPIDENTYGIWRLSRLNWSSKRGGYKPRKEKPTKEQKD